MGKLEDFDAQMTRKEHWHEGGFGDFLSGIPIVGDMLNTHREREAYDQNYKNEQENLQYQKDLQSQIFQREDTEVQRRTADLKAAGLNPILAAGGGASTGPAISTKAPERQPVQADTNSPIRVTDLMMSLLKMNKDFQYKDLEMINLKKTGHLLDLEADKKSIDNKILAHDLDWKRKTGQTGPQGTFGPIFTLMKGYTDLLEKVPFIRNRRQRTYNKKEKGR